jgi:hypothetical protein
MKDLKCPKLNNNLFCFKNICIESFASKLFIAIFIMMTFALVTNIYALTNAFSGYLISPSTYLFQCTYFIILFVIGLGLFRIFLEIPVVLYKILYAFKRKD